MAIDPKDLAGGQVVTGFSFPVVALYNYSEGTVSYTGGMDLARGVSVDPDIELTNSDNLFYANNRVAESAQRRFRSGTARLTVDGLLRKAENLIMGIPDEAADKIDIQSGEATVQLGVTDYDDRQKIPEVGLGYVVRSQSGGAELFRAVVYTKARFEQFAVPAASEEEEIDWQTTDLSAQLMRDDTTWHRWQRVSDPAETELEAYNAVRVMLGMSAAESLPTA